MDDAVASLLRFEARRRLRTVSAALVALAAGVTLTVVYTMPGGGAEAAGRASLETALVVLGVLAGAVAVSAASSAPADRRLGTTSWLAATGSAQPLRRAAPALAAAKIAVAAAFAGGIFCVGLAAVTGRAVATERMEETLRQPTDLSSSRSAAGTAVVSTNVRPGHAIELDLVPLWRTHAAAGRGTVVLLVSRDEQAVESVEVAVPATVRLDARGAKQIDVRCSTADAYVRVSNLRRVLAPSTSAGTLLLASLWLGLALACGAPLAGLLARAMSAPTSMAAAAMLLVVGVLRDPLRAMASDASVVPGGAFAAAVLSAVTAIAPDLSGLARVFEAVQGRALGLSDGLAACAAPLAYGLALLLLLAFLPAPRSAS